ERVDHEGGIFGAEVAPVVTVREDEAAVVGVAGDPAPERALEGRMVDPLAVVPEAPLPIEDDRALPGGARRRPDTVQGGMVPRLHSRQSSVVSRQSGNSLDCRLPSDN